MGNERGSWILGARGNDSNGKKKSMLEKLIEDVTSVQMRQHCMDK